MTSQAQDEIRGTLTNVLGLPTQDVEKAFKHFGAASITLERAADWIFNGCPGYTEDTGDNSRALVPASQSHPNTQGAQNAEGWAEGFADGPQDPNLQAASALASMHNDKHNNLTAKEQWAPFNENQNQQGLAKKQGCQAETSHFSDDDEQQARGRAGRPSPVDGANKDNAIDLTGSQDLGAMPPLVGAADNEDDDLQKAIKLSLEEEHRNKGFSSTTASASMSRVPSQQQGPPPYGPEPAPGSQGGNTQKSREEKEDEEMQAALSASMADIRGSGYLDPEQGGTDTLPEQKIRSQPDMPVALHAPTAFTSHIPALVQSFYANVPFRRAVLKFDFQYTIPSPAASSTTSSGIYADFHREQPKYLTRTLLPGDVHPAVLRTAALQRLFVYLKETKRSRGFLTDFTDAFDLRNDAGIITNPLDEIIDLHTKISTAFLECATHQIARRLSLPPDQVPESEILPFKRILATQAVADPHFIQKHQATLPDAQQGEAVKSIGQSQLETEWASIPELNVWSSETNETYSALDGLLAPEHGPKVLIVQPSQSLSLAIRRGARPASADPLWLTTGSSDADQMSRRYQTSSSSTSFSGELFKIQPSVYLDRYDYKQKDQILALREDFEKTKVELRRLKDRRTALSTSRKAGKPHLTEADSEGKEIKGTLERVAEHLRMLEKGEIISDQTRNQEQRLLADKLEHIIALLKEEIRDLGEKVDTLSKDTTSIWEQALPTEVGPYELRSVIMWRGLPGRETTYVYMQSGQQAANLHWEAIVHERWWRVGDAKVEEVSKAEAVSDTTGMYMNGGGSLLHLYVNKTDEEAALEDMTINPTLPEGIIQDNKELANGLPSELTSGWFTSSAQFESQGLSNTAMPMEPSAPAGDASMATSDEKLTQSPASAAHADNPISLRGGSSRQRRSSVSSDTGSVASTSRVRIEDGDDCESDGAGEETETVELGFAEKMGKKGFKVVKDVGKIGGKPTWLNPALPLEQEMVKCRACEASMSFLLQINAPRDEMPQACYRTFYVYTCAKALCLKKKAIGSTRVFRSQLPAENPCYEVSDPEHQATLQRFKDKQYSSFCANCKMKHDKAPCGTASWKEWLIETGPEELEETDETTSPDDVEKAMKAATLSNEDTTADINEPDTSAPVDSAFLHFQEKLRNEPDQVLRYYYPDAPRRAGTLWVSDEEKPSPSQISACSCGSKRSCEFQVLSTLLSYLGIDDLDQESLDFGTIAVYSCDASCNSTPAPAFVASEPAFERFAPRHGWEEELAYVQNYSSRGVDFR